MSVFTGNRPLPQPMEWAALAASQPEAQAVQRFRDTIEGIGFQNACYVSEVPRFRLTIPDREEMHGNIVSPACEAEIRASSGGGQGASIAPSASNNQREEMRPQEILKSRALPALVVDSMTVLADHGLQSGWTFPVTDRKKNTFSTLLIDCTTNRDDQAALIEEHADYLQSAVLFLREGLEVNRLQQLSQQEDQSLLSTREEECLNWSACGRSSKEIAGVLGISVPTVNEYLTHATRKLGAANRTQAVTRALLAALAHPDY